MPECLQLFVQHPSLYFTVFVHSLSFWRPGAEDGTRRVKYYVSGFVHLQDLIESALLRFTESMNDKNQYEPLGSYLQLMPYPCYTRDT